MAEEKKDIDAEEKKDIDAEVVPKEVKRWREYKDIQRRNIEIAKENLAVYEA